MSGSLRVGAKLAVSLALLGYLLWTADLEAVLRRVRGGDAVLLAAAVALYGMILVLSTWRWQRLLEAQGYPASLGHLSASYLVATFFNNFLPSSIGGDVIRVRDGTRLTGCTTTSLAVVAIDRLLGFGALYVLALAAYVSGPASLRGLVGARPVLIGLGVVFVGLGYVFFRVGTARRLVAAVGLAAVPWVRQRFERAQAAIHVYRSRVGTVGVAFGASLALQFLVVCYFYAVAHALRISLPFAACFLMVPLCSLLQAVPVSFNGWGVRESLFILYFAHIGLPRESALAFSLVGAGLIVLLSLSGAVVWSSRGRATVAVPPA